MQSGKQYVYPTFLFTQSKEEIQFAMLTALNLVLLLYRTNHLTDML